MEYSISKLKLFKACRRAYYFRYVEKLVPIHESKALEIGSSYHELIEWLYNHGNLDGVAEDGSTALAMAYAYQKYIYPKLSNVQTEVWFDKCYSGIKFHGRLDGMTEHGLVEHKTTAMDLDKYEYNLQWDEQLLLYMWLTGARTVFYTIIRKPNIRRKKDESDDAFFKRMVEWYDEETDSKIRLLKLTRAEGEIAEGMADLYRTAEAIEQASGCYYKNTCYCDHWGGCEYAPICLNYVSNQQYVGFIREEDEDGTKESW